MPMEVVVYACQQAVPDPDALRAAWGKEKIRLQVMPEPCSSKMEAFQLLRTLAKPVHLVWVIGCAEDLCRYTEGSRRLGKRIAYTKRYLQEIGLEPARVGRSLVTPGDQSALAGVVAEIKEKARGLKPNRLKPKATK
jgi:F420-non-reducing hydrogenase iron-sulfur subunit